MKSLTVFAFERLCVLTSIPCSGSLWNIAPKNSPDSNTKFGERQLEFCRCDNGIPLEIT